MWRDGVGYGHVTPISPWVFPRTALMKVRSYFLVYEWLVQRHLRTTGARREDVSPVWAVTYGAAAGYGLWAR